MELTRLEKAILNVQELAAGLAALAMVQRLITQGEEARCVYLDRSIDRESRVEALKSGRNINMSLALVAAVQEVAGISA